MKIEEKTASEVDVFIKQLIAQSLLFDIIMNALHPFMGQKGYEKSQKMFWKHDDWLSIICIYIYIHQPKEFDVKKIFCVRICSIYEP